MSPAWDGKERRSKSLSVHDEVLILNNQFEAITERITSHKKSQDEGLRNIQESVDKLTNLLFPHDGTDGIIHRVKNLEKVENDRKKQHDNIIKIAIGSITALILTIAAWIGKIVIFFIKQSQ